jgi:hypothetical protein
MRHLLTATALSLVLAAPALVPPALAAPPPDARPASEILRLVEQRPDFRHLEEMEWDDDGHWEIEIITRDGGKLTLRIDPVSGEARTR